MRSLRRGALICALALSGHLLILSAGSARAAFPGVNGKIVFNGPNGHLFTINADGTGRTDLGVVGGHPAWSPNGRKIAFTRTDLPNTGDEGSETVEIFSVDADGSNLTQVTRSGSLKHQPAWSPDGQKIAYWLSCEGCDPDASIHVVNADGTNERQLTNFYSSDPAWSPDGTQIAFSGADAGRPKVFLMNSDGTCPRPIDQSPESFSDVSPNWSPDGGHIVFQVLNSLSAQQFDLYVIGRDGSGLRKITDHPSNDREPAWSPDGTSIVFYRFPATGLIVVDPQGGNERALTSEGDANPDWQRLPLGTTGPSSDFQHGPLSGPLHEIADGLPDPLGGRQGLVAEVACTVLQPIGL